MIQVTQVVVPDAVRTLLHGLHDVAGRDTSDKQSIRGGTQISLKGTANKCLNEFIRSIVPSVREYVKDEWEFSGVWSIRMQAGGFHVEHNHPQGKVSGVCYVDVPDSSSGHLKFGEKTLPVKAGDVVLFPSMLPHGTTVYEGEKPRLTVAFDVVTQ